MTKTTSSNESRRNSLFEKSTADPSRVKRVTRLYDFYLRRLRELREERAWRRFTELDRDLGRDTGYLVGVFAHKEPLQFERLLMILDFFDMDLATFASGVGSSPELPPSSQGLLSMFKPKSYGRRRKPSYYETVMTWGERVEISQNGLDYPIDVDGILKLTQAHREAALRTAEGAIEGLLELSPEAIDEETANRVVRLLTVLAELLRKREQRLVACDFLELSFDLESKIDRPLTRAFIYRAGCQLLFDWGLLSQALVFIERSQELCVMRGDCEGLGRSLFLKATYFGLSGQHEEAAETFQASLEFYREKNHSFRFAVQHSIAWTWVQVGQLGKALAASTNLEKLLEEGQVAKEDVVRAYYHGLLAELDSLGDDYLAAERHFETADKIFEKHGATLERVYQGLCYVRHSIRWAEVKKVPKAVEAILALATRIEDNDWAEAIVLEILQSALVGELTLAGVEQAIAKFQQTAQPTYAQPIGSTYPPASSPGSGSSR